MSNGNRKRIDRAREQGNPEHRKKVQRNLMHEPQTDAIEIKELQHITSFLHNHGLIPRKDPYYLRNLDRVKLDWKELRQVPKGIRFLPYVKTLEMNVNNLISLPEEIQHLKGLERFSVCANELLSIPRSLEKLSNLRVLDFCSNHLETFPKLRGFHHLRLLNLSNNRIASFPGIDLKCLKSLHTLCLDENRIDKIPDDIIHLTALESLHLRSNRLKSLPESLPPEISHLNLRDNLFESFPVSLNKIYLDRLILDDNFLISLPPEIGKMTFLSHLGVSNNKLEEVAVEISLLVHLKFLDLSGNNLGQVPLEVGKVRKLEHLNLTHNPLENELLYIANDKDVKINANGEPDDQETWAGERWRGQACLTWIRRAFAAKIVINRDLVKSLQIGLAADLGRMIWEQGWNLRSREFSEQERRVEIDSHELQ